MNQLNASKVGFAVGGALAIFHALWSLMVAIGLAQVYLDWIFKLHFLNFQYSINTFSFGNAIMLVIVTGIIGYVMGYIAGWCWNMAHRSSHTQ